MYFSFHHLVFFVLRTDRYTNTVFACPGDRRIPFLVNPHWLQIMLLFPRNLWKYFLWLLNLNTSICSKYLGLLLRFHWIWWNENWCFFHFSNGKRVTEFENIFKWFYFSSRFSEVVSDYLEVWRKFIWYMHGHLVFDDLRKCEVLQLLVQDLHIFAKRGYIFRSPCLLQLLVNMFSRLLQLFPRLRDCWSKVK